VGGATPAPPPFFFATKITKYCLKTCPTKSTKKEEIRARECNQLMYCMTLIRVDNLSLGMMTGVFIEWVFPTTTTCPSCLQQQSQQQSQQQFQQL